MLPKSGRMECYVVILIVKTGKSNTIPKLNMKF